MEPEEVEVCPRYIVKYSTRSGSNIFLRDLPHQRNKGLFCGKQALVGVPRREGSHARKLAK